MLFFLFFYTRDRCKEKSPIRTFVTYYLFFTFFLFFINKIKSFRLNRLNVFDKITTEIIAKPPPNTAEIKLPKKCKEIFEIRWPITLHGAINNEYLKVEEIRFILTFGITFLIFEIFNKVMIVIVRKKHTMTLLILIRGVNTTSPNNSTAEPIM